MIQFLKYIGNTEEARILIEHGAEVNAKAINEQTPLHLAAQRGILLKSMDF